MPQKAIEIFQYKCTRCGYEWIGRSREKPMRCAKCKTPYWDKERKHST